MCIRCGTGSVAKCTDPGEHKTVLAPELHGALEHVLKAVAGPLQSVAAACSCNHPQCWAAVARAGLEAMEAQAATGDGKRAALLVYDPDLLEVGRVAALRLKSRRGSGRLAIEQEMRVLADAFEELTRSLPHGE